MGQPKQNKALGRRKACDFCCRKKIKCDAKSPKCSNCVVHDVTCLWTPGVAAPKGVTKRTAAAAPPPLPVPPAVPPTEGTNTGSNNSWLSAIEQRLATVESLLGERMVSWPATPSIWNDAPTPNVINGLFSSPGVALPLPPTPSAGMNETNEADPSPPQHTLPVGQCPPQESTPGRHLTLPPQHVVYPIIRRYFSHCNQDLPIFHEASFNTMILHWYRSPSPSSGPSSASPSSSSSTTVNHRDPATWAVINIAMALALRQAPIPSEHLFGQDSHDEDNDRLARQCITNAQSVLDTLVTRDEDFKGLQTLLGLSVLFMSSPSPKPACVLLATAVKLVHRLRAHTKEGRDSLAPTTALQRDRLFWVTYILDRDLSMRSIEPYIQQDTEYDVEPPSLSIPDDEVGMVVSQNGTQKINLFHYRVRLALIQGSLHDVIHSVRARSQTPDKRSASSSKLALILWQWRSSLPEAFRPEKLAGWAETGGAEVVPRALLSLHITYFLCFFMAFRLHVRDADWIRQLSEFSEQCLVSSGVMSEYGLSVPMRDTSKAAEMLPDHWVNFVEAARKSLDLIAMIDEHDYSLIWSSTCLYQASLTILIANNLTISHHHLHHHIESDTTLIEQGLKSLRLRLTDCNIVLSKHCSIQELYERSKLAVQAYTAEAATSSIPIPLPF